MAGRNRRVRAALVGALLGLVLSVGTLAPFAQAGIGAAHAAGLGGGPRATYTPNTLARFRATGDAWGRAHPAHPTAANAPVAGPRTITGKSPAQMGATSSSTTLAQPIQIALDPILLVAGNTPLGPALSYTSTDGLLGLAVSEHSLDMSQAVVAATGASAVGPYTLVFRQTQGGVLGQDQQIGQFTLQVQDSQGHAVAGAALAGPVTLRFHVLPSELAGVNPNGIRLAWVGTGNEAASVPAASVNMSYDAAAGWLGASSPTVVNLFPTPAPAQGGALTPTPMRTPTRHVRGWVADPTASGSGSGGTATSGSPLDPAAGPLALDGTLSDANAASTEHLSLGGNQGDLGFGVPLDLPPAAGGLVPPLQLTYSSAGPNGRNRREAPAGEVGDGWNLSLGSITYDSTTGLFYLNGIAGDSEPLLCCMDDAHGNHFYVPHHHPELEITTGDNNSNPQTTGMWFRIRAPDGLEYDLGRTDVSPYSLRSTVDSSGHLLYYQWDVSQVFKIDSANAKTPSGALQQYRVQYWQSHATSQGVTYVRDAAISEVDYNYNQASSPAPDTRILFSVHWPDNNQSYDGGLLTATVYGNNYNCASTPPGTTTLRCDDPVAQPGWDAAPLTMSAFTLDTMTEQVYYGTGWQTVRQYQFNYAPDSPFYTCWDGQGLNYACSGEHLLSGVREIPYQNGTAQPSLEPIAFGYTGTRQNLYVDTTETVGGNYASAQTWWQYLAEVNDEQTGRHFTASYATGWANSHGVPSGSVTDPTTCDSVSCSNPEDRQWSRQVVTSTTDKGTGLTTSYAYQLPQPCGTGCTEDTWIPPNGWNACNGQVQPPTSPNPPCLEGDWQNFYRADFMGFAQVTVTRPDSSTSVAQYEAGQGWGSNDWGQANAYDGMPLVEDVYQGAPTGTPLEEARHSYLVDGNGNAICPVTSGSNQLYQQPYAFCFTEPASQTTYVGGGANSSPAVPSATETWSVNTSGNGQNHYYLSLTSTAVTGNDLLADSFTNYGSTQPTFTTSYSYTYYDGQSKPYYLVNLPAQVTLGDQLGNQWACSRANYDSQPYTTGLDTSLSAGLLTESDTYTTCGAAPSGPLATGYGYDVYGQPVVGTDADAMGGVNGHTGCTVAAGSLLQVAPVGATAFSRCTGMEYTTRAYPVSGTNALNQTASTAWDVVQGVPTGATDVNGVTTSYGGGPVYEYSGTPHSLTTFEDVYAQVAEPQAQYGWNTRVYAYSFCAIGTASAAPCVEQDTVTNLDGTNMAVSRSFYDRDGRWVETRTTGPTAGTDTVTFASYDDINDKVFASLPCQVSAFVGSRSVVGSYTAPAGVTSGADQGSSTAYVDPNTAGTSCAVGTALASTTYRDALGRSIASDDALGTGVGPSGSGCVLAGSSFHHTNCVQLGSVVASGSGVSSTDGEPYFRALAIDANGHQSASYTDALGRAAYTQRDSGASQQPVGSGIASYAVSQLFYDGASRLRKVIDPDGNVTSYTLDAAGRLLSASDPDLGTWSYTLDPDGNVTEQIDARGASGTTYAFYDGLDRLSRVSTDAGGTLPLATYSYDQQGTTCASTSTSYPIGRLCQEQFWSGPGRAVTGSYTYTYDLRGRTYDTVLSLSGPSTPQASYSLSASYDDADRVSSVFVPAAGPLAGEFLTYNYDNTRGGGLDSITSNYTSPTALLAHNLSYSVQGWLTGWQSGSDAAYQAGFIQSQDGGGRLATRQLTMTPSGGTVAQVGQVQPTYDAAGNVATLTTSLGAIPGVTTGGSETQAFCYDEQDRLVWAGTAGSGPCGTVGSEGITGAGYSASYSYDPIGRIASQAVTTSGGSGLAGAAQGSYSYGDAAHVHAVTAVGSGGTTSYSAAYDAAGDMTCRALGSSSCTATPATGQSLSYDALRRLASWQNGSSSSEQYAYDGEGTRVWRQTTSGSTTTTTVSILGVEDVTLVSGGATTATRYYRLPGGVTATRDSSGLVYEASDQLGTPIASLNLSTGIVGEQLRAPYGQPRYAATGTGSTGGMRTPFGFTGQREDTTPTGSSGLDDFHARMYDAETGRFTTADDAQPGLGDPGGMDGYAYVGGMVENATDPSGQVEVLDLLGGKVDQSGQVGTKGGGQGGSDAGGGGGNPFVPLILGLLTFVGLGDASTGIAQSPGAASTTSGIPLPTLGPGPVPSPGRTQNRKTKIPPIISSGGGSNGGSGGTGGSGSGTETGSETPTTTSATETDPPEEEPQTSTDGAIQGGGVCCGCGCLPAPRGSQWWRDNPGVTYGGNDFPSLTDHPASYFVRGNGAALLIPREVAMALNGRSFRNFRDFRAAFWIAMSASGIAEMFGAANQALMARGFAPRPPGAFFNGKQGYYELDHIQAIQDGGPVYDLGNLHVLASLVHDAKTSGC